MPIKTKLFFLAILIVAVAASSYHFSSNLKHKSQPKSFSPILQSGFSSRGMADRIISIEITSRNVADDIQEMTATVSMPFNFDGELNYKWQLGEKIEVVSGEIRSQIKGYSTDSPIKIRIKVKGFTKEENRQIGMEVIGEAKNRKIYGDGIIASLMENTFEHTVQNVERIKAQRSGKKIHE